MAVVTIAVRATPGASTNKIGGSWIGPDGEARLVVRVMAPADSGRANKAIESLIAGAFGLPKSAVSITSGAKNRLKTVSLTGPDEAVLRKRYEDLLGESA